MPLVVGARPLESVVVATAPDGTTWVVELDHLGRRFTVGRARDNALCLPDPRISSGRHCAFVRDDDGGERVQQLRRLHVGDVVTLGGSTLRFAHRRAALAPSLPPPLLEAICAAPDDLEPRLVAADWLLERGAPRGELIQLQAQLARAHDRELAQACAALLDRYETDWIAPLPVPVERWTFEEGFVSEVRLPRVLATDEALAALRAVHPIRRVVVD